MGGKSSNLRSGGLRDVATSKDRYKMVSQMDLRKSRDPFYKRAVEVRREQKLSSVPVNGSGF